MRVTALAMMMLASACVGAPDTRPINHALLAAPAPAPELDFGGDGDVLALALSGGGARAASFSLGVLLQLRDMKGSDGRPLIDHIGLVTAVSGGSVIAAWFGQHGAAGLDGFRAVALDKDWQGQLNTSFVWPDNLMRLMQGGMNGPDKLAAWLDKEVYAGGHLSDIPTLPHIIINATDLYSGAPFAFASPYFQAICSDLGSVRIADAVAASMSVPIAFRPVVVKSYAKDCPQPLPPWVDAALQERGAPMLLRETARSFQFYRDPTRMQYLHLTDGGVSDNFGLSSLVTLHRAGASAYAPFSARDAVKLNRLTFLVINAERSASGEWALKEAGPDGMELIDAALSAATNAPKRAATDAFAKTLGDWQAEMVAWRCSLTVEQARDLGAGEGWNCKDVQFRMDMVSFADLPPDTAARLGKAETVVSLPKDLVDDLIAGGRKVIEINPYVKSMLP